MVRKKKLLSRSFSKLSFSLSIQFLLLNYFYNFWTTLIKTVTTQNNLEQSRTNQNNPEQSGTTWNKPEQPGTNQNNPEQPGSTRNNLQQPDTRHFRKLGPRPRIFCGAQNLPEIIIKPGISKNWEPFIGETRDPRPFISTGTRDQGPGTFKNIREDGTQDL